MRLAALITASIKIKKWSVRLCFSWWCRRKSPNVCSNWIMGVAFPLFVEFLAEILQISDEYGLTCRVQKNRSVGE